MLLSWIESRITKNNVTGKEELAAQTAPVSSDLPPPSAPRAVASILSAKADSCGNIGGMSPFNSLKLSGRLCLPIKANKIT